MAIKGRFRPLHPEKYRGDSTQIIYRSSWELKFARRLDTDPRVEEWSSETFFIPYFDPAAGRRRRYFPDFRAKMDGRTIVFEIKPLRQTLPPVVKKRRARKAILNETATYITNLAKWEAAKAYCAARNWEFKILTEKELQIYDNAH